MKYLLAPLGNFIAHCASHTVSPNHIIALEKISVLFEYLICKLTNGIRHILFIFFFTPRILYDRYIRMLKSTFKISVKQRTSSGMGKYNYFQFIILKNNHPSVYDIIPPIFRVVIVQFS